MSKYIEEFPTEIKKGVTVIHTKPTPIKNKHGYWGIIKYGENRYEATIHDKRRKIRVGLFDTLDEAVMARKIAEIKMESGEFASWIKTRPHGNSHKIKDFWEKEFDNYTKNRGK